MLEIYPPSDDSYFLSNILKKEIPKLLNKNKNPGVLEVGCGSGVQLSTLKGLEVKSLLGLDINQAAVNHCRGLGFNCILSDLFSNIKKKFDLIIFNPPYLPEDKDEPKSSRLATTGGKEGSRIINKFLKQAKKHLNENGKIILLTSNLAKKIYWKDYKKKLLGKKKLFFEELYVWELNAPTDSSLGVYLGRFLISYKLFNT
ncbi:MAG TPA: methyltransferase domain-containing protein [Candidatus Pacearchaeota archaeon]|nr:N5-glutamine S-adenosyl-L-methionine-dependent methyltransferase [archaeon BMS3Abin17]HDK42824.1 methyltransferase domain-containing protein [Candidatus Pacearchaeota archaeon]HDZ61357.1 methyltransferase domain-containing protein [Candidatus Pacearchaeota archaeon]